jgi:hypothetical protein
MLMAGEPGSGVLTAFDWDKPTHLACTVRANVLQKLGEGGAFVEGGREWVRLLRSMWVKGVPQRAAPGAGRARPFAHPSPGAFRVAAFDAGR